MEVKPTINLRDCETVKCESCGGIYFREVLILKKVSRFQIPNAVDDQMVPIPVHMCNSCNHVNAGANPFEDNTKSLIND